MFKNKSLIKTFNFILASATPILLVAIWQILSSKGIINQSIMPAPSIILRNFIEMIKTGELEGHLAISAVRVIKGFTVGASLGIIFGILIGLFKKIDTATTFLIGILRPIPNIAWIPMLILWMGIDEGSKVSVIAIGSFWPILINTIHGIKSTDKKLLEVAYILEKSNIEVLTKIVFPAALPAIFTGVRLGVSTSWMCVVGAEMIAASKGIGYLIMFARELSQPDIMLVGVFSIGFIGLLIDVVLINLQRRVLKWNFEHGR
ncbi:ABC transporter permease [Clostridium cylindrosporum]|uniref:Putative aliphatic sulfonates transport permease protein SsuC n=1 Tax=Clostridium cylindrosporum DSM 605 TaxID=1121307 RepID=A0A0J8D5N8_CLOCY|nr:ABC transporter permease [Clostridium cylindrosporum]KMT21157.1 putative aliphatic sulfonates transport permease protein SsuC [Clostridium cylindrosporum DSM 605]